VSASTVDVRRKTKVLVSGLGPREMEKRVKKEEGR